mgnify:CR=1 FL=1|tara:strand:- start:152 stop:505 length:354 start_codon:yes stop_codon:yes gene_type:complete
MFNNDLLHAVNALLGKPAINKVNKLIKDSVDNDHDYSLKAVGRVKTACTWKRAQVTEEYWDMFTSDCQDALEKVIKEWQESVKRNQLKDYRDTDEWQETHGMTDEQREAIIDKGDNK